MITIVRAVRTSIACPAQWDAWDGDGNYYYLRFRHSYGQVTQYKDENWVEAPWIADELIDKTVPGWARHANTAFIADIASFETEEENIGWIELEEFAQKAGIALAPDIERKGFGDHVAAKLAEDGIVAGEGSELDGIIGKWNEVAGG